MRRILFTFLSAIALVATGVVGAIAVGGTGTVDPPPRIAFLANGIVPADALAAGGIAGQLGAPLFTTPATSLNDDARDGIKAYDPDLVIALGGPVAINDTVLTALSAATGLPIVATTAPDDGIVRVAGGDRFATARAVAGLLAAYDPAYLPVDATALGAIDAATADMADDSDLLDGMNSTDFALSDQSCAPGEVVVSIDATGTIVCAPDQDEIDGGDADTLDGLDATDLGSVFEFLDTSNTVYEFVDAGTPDVVTLDIDLGDPCGSGETVWQVYASFSASPAGNEQVLYGGALTTATEAFAVDFIGLPWKTFYYSDGGDGIVTENEFELERLFDLGPGDHTLRMGARTFGTDPVPMYFPQFLATVQDFSCDAGARQQPTTTTGSGSLNQS